jgi:hypothetical protein
MMLIMLPNVVLQYCYEINVVIFLLAVPYLQTRIRTLRTQYTKAKGIMKSGSEGLSVRRRRTLQKQIDLLGFLAPHLRKRTSLTNMV